MQMDRYVTVVNKNKKKSLPRAVFYQCEWILKDYDRLRELVDSASAAEPAEGAIVFYASDEVRLMSAEVVDEAQLKLDAIDAALSEIPEDYRRDVLDYYAHDIALPEIASDNTWKKWKKIFVETLAHELKLI